MSANCILPQFHVAFFNLKASTAGDDFGTLGPPISRLLLSTHGGFLSVDWGLAGSQIGLGERLGPPQVADEAWPSETWQCRRPGETETRGLKRITSWTANSEIVVVDPWYFCA